MVFDFGMEKHLKGYGCFARQSWLEGVPYLEEEEAFRAGSMRSLVLYDLNSNIGF